jgi:hypothetical protein
MNRRRVTFAKCAECGGSIKREPRYDKPDREAWLHMYQSDWVDNVHSAVPIPDTKEEVAVR